VTVPDLLPFPFFSFDTSAFINGQRDIFRPTTFEPLWDAIAKMIEAQDILAVDEVKREIRRKDDDVAKWVLSQRGLALARGGTVVTQETPANSPRKPRIPDACLAVGVPWMTLPDFVDAQRWQISMG